MRYSLRWRLPFLISCLVALVLSTFLWAAYRRVEGSLVQAAGERAQSAADQVASLLDGTRTASQTRRLGSDPDLRRLVESRTDDARERVRTRLASMAASGPRRIEVWDNAGTRLLDVLVAAVGSNRAPPPDALPPGSAPSAIGLSAIQRSGDIGFVDSVIGIQADETESPGAAAVPLGYVRIRSTFVENPPGIFSRLVGRGAVVRVGNRVGGTWTDFARVAPSAPIDLARPGVTRYRNENGEMRLGAVSLVPDTPWAAWVDFPLAGIVSPARVFFARMTVLAVAFVAVAAILATILAAGVTTPLAEIGSAAASIAAGDYSRRVDARRRDEIGQLGRTFNDMAGDVQSSAHALKALNAELEDRVLARTAALEAANRELESFSYSVSHDLRAPLRHVQGYVEMLAAAADGQLSAKSQRYLKTITEATVEMGNLIDDLLAFSRIGRVQLSEGRVALDDIVRDSIAALEMATRDRKIEWTIAPLPEVIGDPSLLKQVYVNLLGNAVKYTRDRNPARIEIGCAGDEEGRAVLFVRDNGAGFDMQYAHKLFGVFQRLHRADEFEGTGIGLATVRRIVSRHGGRTWAEGRLDNGATIYLTLRPAPRLTPAA